MPARSRPAFPLRRNRPGTAALVARARPAGSSSPFRPPAYASWLTMAAALVEARAATARPAAASPEGQAGGAAPWPPRAATQVAPTGFAWRRAAPATVTVHPGGRGTPSPPGPAVCAGPVRRRRSLPGRLASGTWKVLLPFPATRRPTAWLPPAATRWWTTGCLRFLPRLSPVTRVGCLCPALLGTSPGLTSTTPVSPTSERTRTR